MGRFTSILCASVYVLGASNDIRAADFPTFNGAVSPFDKPVMLQLRPHPIAKASKKTTAYFSTGTEKNNFETLVTAKTEAIKSGDEIIHTYEPLAMSVQMLGQKQEHKVPPMIIRMRMSARNNFIDIETDFQNMSDGEKSPITQYMPIVLKFLNSATKLFPVNGVREGHYFYNITESEINLDEYFPARYLNDNQYIQLKQNLKFSFKGVAGGITTYREREVIFVKISGEVRVKDVHSNKGSVNLFVQINGYSLLDTFTGRMVLTDVLYKGKGTFEDFKFSGEGHEIMNLELNSLTENKLKLSGDSLQKMNLPKAKKECAQLGFKTGTEAYGDCVMKLYK